jgi:hypothetical protein
MVGVVDLPERVAMFHQAANKYVGKFACNLRIDLALNEAQLVFQEKLRRFKQVREHDIEYVPE